MIRKGQRMRPTALAFAAIAVAAAVTACGSGGSGGDPGSSADGLTTVRIVNAGFSKNFQIAKDYGFFAKFGINAELSELPDGPSVINALVGGSADIGYSDVYAGVNAIAHGFDVDLVANNNGLGTTNPVLVKANGPIKTPADLVGKTVELAPFPLDTVEVRGFLRANRVDPSSVKLDAVANQPSFPSALQNGTVDAIVGSWQLLYQNSGQANEYNFAAIGNASTSAYAVPAATIAADWSTAAYAKSHVKIENEFDDALHAFNKWWVSLPAAQIVALEKKYYGVNFDTISGGDPTKLANLVASAKSDDEYGPINVAATLHWYEIGLQYAADQIQKGVNLRSHIFESASLPTPKNWQPSSHSGSAS